MTLIAFGTHRDRAEIITDSATYNLTSQGRTSKLLPLPHLDAAVMEQGSVGFGHRWRYRVLQLDRDRVTGFDDLHRRAPSALRAVWQQNQQYADEENARLGTDVTVEKSIVFHVGASAEAGRFKAYGYASWRDFEPVDLSDGMVLPSPLGLRPGDLELERLAAHLYDHAAGDQEQLEQARTYMDAMTRRGPFTSPTTRKGWVQLAKDVRRDRSTIHISSGLKVIVGGDVMHTTLRAGEVTQRRVHTYDDVGEEFAHVVAGTLHPLSQLAPCVYCDSGQPFIDCCLAVQLDQACPCRSGRPFEACCSVRADHPAEEPTPALVTA